MVKRVSGTMLQSIEVDTGSSQPLTTQILVAMRNLILDGGLQPGRRVPATRTLARDLGVSRTTIIGVYERLIAEGMLNSRTGSGTFVSDLHHSWHAPREVLQNLQTNLPTAIRNGLPDQAVPDVETLPLDPEIFGDRLEHQPRAFTTAMPALDQFPVSQWLRLTAKHWRRERDTLLGYGDAAGYPHLRREVAAFLRANVGITCTDEQIFIVNGAQHAFQVIASFLLQPGERVLFENPGALGARNAFLAANVDLVPVPVDEQGLNVVKGLERAPDFRMAYVTPSHQQPLGVCMSLQRRVDLLNAANATNAWIVEDDYDSEFHYGRHRPPPLKSLDKYDRVLYVGTFSKTLFPALRLGYILVPARLVKVFGRIFNNVLPGVPADSQAILASFMSEMHFSAHLRRMRQIYAERYQVLQESACALLDGMLDIQPVESGLHTVGYLHPDFPEAQVAARAEVQSITVVPIEKYCLEPVKLNGLVLGFSGISSKQIHAGVAGLRQVLDTMKKRNDQPVNPFWYG